MTRVSVIFLGAFAFFFFANLLFWTYEPTPMEMRYDITRN